MKSLQTVYLSTKVNDELPKITTTSIPKDKWGVHETHCCLEHGCKYGNEDCPVTIGLTKQRYDCEYCDEDFYPEREKKEGYFFTPEELKTFLEEYTKRIVENAILKEKKISYPCSSGIEYGYVTLVDKKSITDQLEILKKELNL